MTRKECLDRATACVCGQRDQEYGAPEDNFGRIAKLWTYYLGVAVEAVDVAMMMALLKIARIRHSKAHADSFVDLAGYAACGAGCADAEERRRQAVEAAGRECKACMAEGCEELVQKDAPRTPEEVCRRIVDCNPEVYGHPHVPTGEELVEMARKEL